MFAYHAIVVTFSFLMLWQRYTCNENFSIVKDLDERIQKQQEEEEERKRLKRERKKEKKVKSFLSSFAHHFWNPNFTTSKKFMHTPIDSWKSFFMKSICLCFTLCHFMNRGNSGFWGVALYHCHYTVGPVFVFEETKAGVVIKYSMLYNGLELEHGISML